MKVISRQTIEGISVPNYIRPKEREDLKDHDPVIGWIRLYHNRQAASFTFGAATVGVAAFILGILFLFRRDIFLWAMIAYIALSVGIYVYGIAVHKVLRFTKRERLLTWFTGFLEGNIFAISLLAFSVLFLFHR